EDFKNDSASFLEQKVAMIASTSWRLREILRFNETLDLGLDIGISQVPQITTDAGNLNWATYWGNIVTLNRPNSVASWNFLTWLTEPAQLEKLYTQVEEQSGYFGILYP